VLRWSIEVLQFWRHLIFDLKSCVSISRPRYLYLTLSRERCQLATKQVLWGESISVRQGVSYQSVMTAANTLRAKRDSSTQDCAHYDTVQSSFTEYVTDISHYSWNLVISRSVFNRSNSDVMKLRNVDPEDRQAWRGRLRPRLGSQAAPSVED